MNKKIAVVLLSWAIVLSFVVMVVEIAPRVKAPTTIYVDDEPGGFPPEDYTVIQWAIDNSSDGDTVFVYNGTYYENVLVNKTINLVGEDKNMTIIDGGGIGDVIFISADWVNVSGFTIFNSGADLGDAGIELNNVQNCTLIDNNISSNKYNGIYLYSSSNNNITCNNISKNGGSGIHIWVSERNNIINNTVFLNTGDGIYVWVSERNIIINNIVFLNKGNGIVIRGSYRTTVSNNTLSSNKHIGIWVWQLSQSITIINNKAFNNYGFGISLGASYINIVANNTISLNKDHGIYLWDSDMNTITNNTVSSNNPYGIYLRESNHNRIYQNNFIANKAYDDQENNDWNATYPTGGNYWSDYDGVDYFKGPNQDIKGSDGIGDTNYSIDWDSRDNYPLMFPVGNCTFLYQGWNLISIPFIQSDKDLGIVLRSVEGSYDSVEWYNVTDVSDHWKVNHTSKPSQLNDFDNIDHTMGFWIHITEPGGVLFEYPGTKPTENQTITIHPGWNLVGYPSLGRKNRTEALTAINFGAGIDSIWSFDARTQRWHELSESDYFELGRGYWIHSKAKISWEVPL